VRPGQVWRGRCTTAVSVTVPGLEGSPGSIQIVLDADDTFPVAPVPTVPLDAGVIDADGTGIDAAMVSIDAAMVSIDTGMVNVDAASALATDAPPCDAFVPTVDASPTVGPPVRPPQSGGCGCSLGRHQEQGSALLLLLLALLIPRSRRAASKLNRSREEARVAE
jgi:MYXO-CTERM domain-containing protein